MPDLRQALRDFVATSNSGKYTDEETLLSKFPELKGYDIQTLRDFVATSNSGKYANEDEVFAKFPEFNLEGATLKKKSLSESDQSQQPMANTMVSASEDGSSELQEPPKQESILPSITQEGLKKAMTKKASVPTDMSGKPLFDSKKVEETKTMFKNIEKEKKQLDLEKKKYGDIFDKQLNIKPNVEESQYLKDRLSTINTDLINRVEEYVVPQMQYQFGDLGFKFEKSGVTGDYMIVTAPDDKTKIEISLDNFLDSKSKKQSEILQKFIKDNTPAKGLFVLEKTMREQDVKFNSEKQVDETVKKFSEELNTLNQKQKQFLLKKSKFDEEVESLKNIPQGTEDFNKKYQKILSDQAALQDEMKILLTEEDVLKNKETKLSSAVGKYSINKAKQGTWGGGIWNAFLEGSSSIASGTTSLVIDLATEIAPAGFGMSPKDLKDISGDISKKLGFKGPSESQSIEDWKKTLTEDQLDDWEDEVDDYIKKDLKGKSLPAIRIGNREVFGDADTTKQWSNIKEEGFWGGAILGVSKSLPAMIGGAGPIGAAQRTAAMYAQVSDGLAQEMESNPEFENITENEKLAITLPIGIVGAVLENIGLRNIKSSQGVINNITLRVLGKANKGVTAKTFRELVENEVDGMVSKGLLTITAAGAAEFETGAAQELSETGFKFVYNKIKGKEMFETPDSITDLVENVAVAGAQEAVGGFVLGVPTGVSAAFSQKGFLKMNDVTFETFEAMANDENLQTAYVASLKQNITQGLITTAEAKDQLNNYRNSVGLFRQLPDGLSTQQKKEAMNLLKEKRDLEAYVNGKDNALVVKQKNRIDEINSSLTNLTQQPSAEYIIDEKQYTKEEFISQLEGKTEEELKNINIVVKNDQETSNIITEKFKTDAVQEQATGQVPVQSETGISETVAEGISESKPEVVTETQEEVVVEPTIKDSQIPLKRETFEVELDNGATTNVEVTTNKDGSRSVVTKSDGFTSEGDNINKDNTLSTEEYISKAYGNIKGEPIVEQGNDIMAPAMKEKLTPEQKADLGIEVVTEQVTQEEVAQPLRDVESTAKALESLPAEERNIPLSPLDLDNEGIITWNQNDSQSVAEAYHRAKEEGSNAELVQAVENSLVPTVEVTQPQVVSEVNDLLELDTKDQTSLQRVLDYLDSFDSSLDLDPNELNDVTRVMAIGTAKAVVKTLKTLVKAGITLQEAIKKASEEHKVSNEQIIEALGIVSKQNENKSEGISEFELPGYNRAMDIVEGIISKVRKERNGTDERALEAVLDYLQQDSKVYENATDVQRDAMVRDVRKRFGLNQKSAPSVGRLFGTIKDVAKITMREKDLLVKQIKDKAKAAKEAVRAAKLISEELSSEIKKLQGSGKITKGQASNAIKAFSKVNVFSQKSIDRFTTYMTKLFENAEYAENLSEAKKVRSKIKKLSRDKDKNANLRALAAEFAKIDPSIVEDINTYNEQANSIKKAVDGSSVRMGKAKFAETVNINEKSEYISEALKKQDKTLRDEKIAELKELMGVDAEKFTNAEIEALLDSTKEPSEKYDDSLAKATIKRAFDVYSAMINESIKKGKNIFTDEDVEFSKTQKELIGRFMKMDVSEMDIKESLAAVDSLINFLENQSTAKMEAVVSSYVGEQNSSEVVSKGIKGFIPRKLFMENFGKLLAEQTTTLPVLFEKIFKGFNRGGYVMDLMGLTELINKKAYAQNKSNIIINDYVKQFFNQKANGKKFNTISNVIERGMASFMMRSVIGTQEEMQADFKKRKEIVEHSIDILSKGTKEEKIKGEVYKEVYDKILSNSNSIDDIASKTDDTNLKAIEYWQKQWDSKYDQMSDVSENIYNKVLGKDLNYSSPDKYSKLNENLEPVDLASDQSAFFTNTEGALYKDKASVLKESIKPSKDQLPKNTFIDLSFDKNNSKSMYDALVDIETAAPIRQVEAFMKSDNFVKIMGSAEMARIVSSRVQKYVQNSRKKNPYSNDEFSKTMNNINKIARFGAAQALAGPTQPFKQVIPVIFNTLISAGKLDLTATSNANFMNWLSEQGYAISNRGVESQAQIDSLNKMVEEASNSNGLDLGKRIEKLNDLYLKIFLSNPDAFIAKASWKSYYEQSLKKQGKQSSGIDYSTHEINKDAANYAQRMVDRQQNVSDVDLAGDAFTSKNAATNAAVKIFMPFASFRMNQNSRLAADLSTIGYWGVSSTEDKVIALRSIAGYAAEMVTFKALSTFIGLGSQAIASKFMNSDDDDEKEKAKNNIIKGQVTSTVTDVFSPLPVTDKAVQYLAAGGLDFVQDMMNLDEDQKVSLYRPRAEDQIKQLGMFGIAADRAMSTIELIDIYATGTYKDNFGNEKEVSDENKQKIGQLIGPSILTNIGMLPPESAGIIRKSVKIAKKPEPKIDKALLKKRNPKKYERMFGKGSSDYKIKQKEKEREKRRKKRFGSD